MNTSGSSAAKPISLIPFGYLAVTRLNSLRDYAYLIASTWLPCIWLVFRLSDVGAMQAVIAFAAGYLAFVSAYEVGYLVNDGWDARRAVDGRPRIKFQLSRLYVATFLAVRLGVWVLVGISTGWIQNPIWIGGFAALIVAFAQHNLVESSGLRLVSFYELATLRFLLPIIAIIPAPVLPVAILTALLLYAYPRLISYMDSKGVLKPDVRTHTGFALLQVAALSPLTLYLAFILQSAVIAELLGYFLAVHALWWLGVDRRRAGR